MSLLRKRRESHWDLQRQWEMMIEEGSLVKSGLVAWYDASDFSTLWQDSSRTVRAQANADVIGAWDDKSGNARHLIQATTANKPTLRLNVKNGKPVIRFDGTDDTLRKIVFGDFGDNYSVFMLLKEDADGDNAQGVYEVSTGSTDAGFGMYHATNLVSFMRGASASHAVGNVNRRDGLFYIHNQICSGSNNLFYTNATAPQSVSYTAPNPNTLTQLDLGRLLISDWFLKGDVAEFFIYNRTLTTAERIHNRNYLNAKWRAY